MKLHINIYSEKQLKSVHKEFLDTHIHYQRQLPKLSEEYGKQIVFLVKGMVENFEDENPYLVSTIIASIILKNGKPLLYSTVVSSVVVSKWCRGHGSESLGSYYNTI